MLTDTYSAHLLIPFTHMLTDPLTHMLTDPVTATCAE